MNEMFQETLIERISQIGKQIDLISKKFEETEDSQHQQNILASEISSLKEVIAGLDQQLSQQIPTAGKMDELAKQLDAHKHTMESLPSREDHHIHHFKWPLGVAIGLLLLLVFSVYEWIDNCQKLNQYIASDTKYRKLKLINDKDLQYLLYLDDSTYRANPKMRKQVLQKEADRKRKLELRQKARESRLNAKRFDRQANEVGKD